jgi:hypothetical protein
MFDLFKQLIKRVVISSIECNLKAVAYQPWLYISVQVITLTFRYKGLSPCGMQNLRVYGTP